MSAPWSNKGLGRISSLMPANFISEVLVGSHGSGLFGAGIGRVSCSVVELGFQLAIDWSTGSLRGPFGRCLRLAATLPV